MSHLQSIIEKCHLANPKLLEISRGCELKRKDSFYIVTNSHFNENDDGSYTATIVWKEAACPMWVWINSKSLQTHDYEPRKYELVWHPITLQDILLCFAKAPIQPKYLHWYNDNDFLICLPFTEERKMNCVYDLTKSPYDQSEEVLEFISKNI